MDTRPYKGPRRLVQYHEGNYSPQCILWHLSCVCVGGEAVCLSVTTLSCA